MNEEDKAPLTPDPRPFGVKLQRDVNSVAEEAATGALKSLQPEIHKAGQALKDLQKVSLWRATLQHAVVAIAVTLIAVWWYVPPLSEITARAVRSAIS